MLFCKPCLEHGHQCPALPLQDDEEARCIFCDDGVPCPKANLSRLGNAHRDMESFSVMEDKMSYVDPRGNSAVTSSPEWCEHCHKIGHYCPAVRNKLCSYCDDGLDCPEVERDRLLDTTSPRICKPCKDMGHTCTSRLLRDGVEMCIPCSKKQPCKHQATALAKPPPLPPVKIENPKVDPERDVGDLMKILSQTLGGILSDQITPAQANAVCNTANTVLKIALTVDRLRKERVR
jgi:hypothetical protein